MADAIDDTPTIEDRKKHWVTSILNTNSPPPSRNTRIPKVPIILKKRVDHEIYYVPKVVSFGPYHHGKPSLESMEYFKPLYTNKLLNGNQESILTLYESLAQMVLTLREYYEDDADHLFDDEFTRMMLLDGCFILYFIKWCFLIDGWNALGLTNHQVLFVRHDIFLLENQIPYEVLTEVMKFVQDVPWDLLIKRFIDDNILAPEHFMLWKKVHKPKVNDPIPTTTSHLLELLQNRLTKERSFNRLQYNEYGFANVNELIEAGIHFKRSRTRSVARIKFSKCGFFANLELPPITVDDSTKPMLLNLVAYEMCCNDTNASWVTTYICLLNSLMAHSDDVKVLRKARILENRLGNDDEVAQLFKEIGKDLAPNFCVYAHEMLAIQKHYDSKSNTWISQFKHEYIKSPWAFLALLGGLIALFLSSVQTYFSVWGNKSHCDSFCLYLKKHHLP